jgi:TRAP-type C4-dicarboxylate transport system permease small subunit/TM2 domain-containing membrane protein YozV
VSKKRRNKKKKAKSQAKATKSSKPADKKAEPEPEAEEAKADDDEAEGEDEAEASDDGPADGDAQADDDAQADEEDDAEQRAAAKARRKDDEIHVHAPPPKDDDDDNDVEIHEAPKAKVKKTSGVKFDVTKARLLALIPGFHRFYMRRYVSGFLFLVTFGFLGLGTLIDIIAMKSLCKSSEELEVEEIDLAPPRDENETPAIRTMKWIDHGVGLSETVFLVVCLMGLIGVASAQAISMKVYSKSWAWSFDVIRYSVFFIAMAGASLAAQQERQISMDFVSHNVSPWWRARLRFFLRIFIIIICVILYIGGMKLREAAGGAYELIPPKLGIAALPVGALLIAFHMAMHNVIDLLYWKSGNEPPEQEQAAV